MDTSVFLARLLGPMLVVLAIGLIVRQDSWSSMAKEFIASQPLVFLSGFLTLLGGLALVNTHNVWEAGWPVIITIFGWLAVIGGAARMLCPQTVMGIGEKMLNNKTYLTVGGVVEGLLGLWLCYVGYLA
ncbi:MAG: hypothetical protein K8F92_12630 [Hyphomicrobium sp.]|uniref:hypothetical protein n=1 Tax=Hyphomicrobium sp. TaxID=82 RepID=UPI0013250717|nr:hypothetical protein [Hyphomicrobium sp.]KAB2938137.1 MAG: hypothetical protein F9K20_19210 [Hyphomicrobium sp.]MBZ0210484.1 hypothetical protein [Hyphomicrobium sp.]